MTLARARRGSVVGFLLLLGFAVIVIAIIGSFILDDIGLGASLASRTLTLGIVGVIILGMAIVASWLLGVGEEGPDS